MSGIVHVEVLNDLITKKPHDSISSPWLEKGRPRRMLVQDFHVLVLTKDRGTLPITVPAGYTFDGASIPRLLWWVFPPSYNASWEAAAVHDWMYSHLHTQYSKSFADEVFYQIMLSQGAHPFVAKVFYKSVQLFGKGGW